MRSKSFLPFSNFLSLFFFSFRILNDHSFAGMDKRKQVFSIFFFCFFFRIFSLFFVGYIHFIFNQISCVSFVNHKCFFSYIYMSMNQYGEIILDMIIIG